MKFCVECGQKTTGKEAHCTNCGAKLHVDQQENSEKDKTNNIHSDEVKGVPIYLANQDDTDVHQQQDGQAASAPPPRNRKPMSKTTKIILSIIIFVAALGFGTHKWLQSYFDPIQELEAMDNAIIDNDMDTFLSYINFDENAALDKQSYFDYIKEHSWESDIRHQYHSIIEDGMESNQPLHSNIDTDDGYTLYKIKKDKKYGLYPTFTLQANPIELQALSNLDKTVITFNDKETKLDNQEELADIGYVYPGTFDISAKAEGDFGELTYEETLNISQNNQEAYVDFTYGFVQVNSSFDYGDAIVYIDGEKTDYSLKEDASIGPFPEDKNVKVHAEWTDEDGNIVTSNIEEIDFAEDYSDVYFEFDETKTVAASLAEDDDTNDKETEAGQFVLAFREAYENAVNHADYKDVEPYVKKDSHAAKELKKFIKDMDDGFYSYDFEENQVIDIKTEKDNKFTVQTNEKFTFRDDDGEKYKYDRKKSYDVEEDDGKFLIKKIKYDDTKKKKAN